LPKNTVASPDKSQSDKFKDLAREVETNDDEAAFDQALKKLAKASPEKKSPGEK
jgi:hypothetical protein